MLTVLTSPKPFPGHCGVIQRNANQGCELVHANAKVILFDEEGAAEEASRELGARYTPCEAQRIWS